MGDVDVAKKESLNQIIEMQAGTEAAARAQYQLGMHLQESGRSEESLAALRLVPSQWPRWHAKAGIAIAALYEQQGDFDAAAREYRKVISLHPESFPAARAYARRAEIYAARGDEVPADNMRECALRTYERLSTSASSAEERRDALYWYAIACRELQRWDQANDALLKSRKQAVRDKDATRRAELDRQLGLLHFEREQYGSALKRFKESLDHAKRKGDLEVVVPLTEKVVACQKAAADDAGAVRSYRSLVNFVHRSKLRVNEAQTDPDLAPIMVEAYLHLGRTPDARNVRTRLRRMKGDEPVKQALAAVEAQIAAAE